MGTFDGNNKRQKGKRGAIDGTGGNEGGSGKGSAGGGKSKSDGSGDPVEGVSLVA